MYGHKNCGRRLRMWERGEEGRGGEGRGGEGRGGEGRGKGRGRERGGEGRGEGKGEGKGEGRGRRIKSVKCSPLFHTLSPPPDRCIFGHFLDRF